MHLTTQDAYIEISLYGKGYIEAAKDTWRLMKDRGIDALANDSLVGMVIMWGSYLNGFLCGLFAWVYLKCELCRKLPHADL